MSSSLKIPRAVGAGADARSVITGRAWNEELAPALEGLRTMGGNGDLLETAVGSSRFDRPRYSRWLPWELFLDAAANKVTVWHRGSYVFGPALDDTGISTTEKDAAAMYPSRFGHPWVPRIGVDYIDRKSSGMYPTLTAADSTVTYVWVKVVLNPRTVPFGEDFDNGSGPDFGQRIEEDGTKNGDYVDDNGDTVTLNGITTKLAMRVNLALETYDILEVEMLATTTTPPTESLTTRHYLVGWVDRTQSPYRKRMFLNGPIFVDPPIRTKWSGTGSTDVDGGLVDDQSPLPPRGEWADDSDNSERGSAV